MSKKNIHILKTTQVFFSLYLFFSFPIELRMIKIYDLRNVYLFKSYTSLKAL